MDWLILFCDVTTVGLCVICKVPQIALLRKANSAEGLNTKSIQLELLTYLISLSYNVMRGYPLLGYLEDPFLSLQTLIVLLMVYHYDGGRVTINRLLPIAATCLSFTLLTYFSCALVLHTLLALTLPMKIMSKLLQLKQIYVTKNPGNISLLSWAINIYTCVTRIITTLFVTSDATILLKHTISVTLNACVCATALYYSKRKVH